MARLSALLMLLLAVLVAAAMPAQARCASACARARAKRLQSVSKALGTAALYRGDVHVHAPAPRLRRAPRGAAWRIP